MAPGPTRVEMLKCKKNRRKRPTFCIFNPRTRQIRRLQRIRRLLNVIKKHDLERELKILQRGVRVLPLACEGSPPSTARSYQSPRNDSPRPRKNFSPTHSCGDLRTQVPDTNRSNGTWKEGPSNAEDWKKKLQRLHRRSSCESHHARRLTEHELTALIKAAAESYRSRINQVCSAGGGEAELAQQTQNHERKRSQVRTAESCVGTQEVLISDISNSQLYPQSMGAQIGTEDENSHFASESILLSSHQECDTQRSSHQECDTQRSSQPATHWRMGFELSNASSGSSAGQRVKKMQSAVRPTLVRSDVSEYDGKMDRALKILPTLVLQRQRETTSKKPSASVLLKRKLNNKTHRCIVVERIYLKRVGNHDVLQLEGGSQRLAQCLAQISSHTISKGNLLKSCNAKLKSGGKSEESSGDICFVLRKTVHEKSSTQREGKPHTMREAYADKKNKRNAFESGLRDSTLTNCKRYLPVVIDNKDQEQHSTHAKKRDKSNLVGVASQEYSVTSDETEGEQYLQQRDKRMGDVVEDVEESSVTSRDSVDERGYRQHNKQKKLNPVRCRLQTSSSFTSDIAAGQAKYLKSGKRRLQETRTHHRKFLFSCPQNIKGYSFHNSRHISYQKVDGRESEQSHHYKRMRAKVNKETQTCKCACCNSSVTNNVKTLAMTGSSMVQTSCTSQLQNHDINPYTSNGEIPWQEVFQLKNKEQAKPVILPLDFKRALGLQARSISEDLHHLPFSRTFIPIDQTEISMNANVHLVERQNPDSSFRPQDESSHERDCFRHSEKYEVDPMANLKQSSVTKACRKIQIKRLGVAYVNDECVQTNEQSAVDKPLVADAMLKLSEDHKVCEEMPLDASSNQQYDTRMEECDCLQENDCFVCTPSKKNEDNLATETTQPVTIQSSYQKLPHSRTTKRKSRIPIGLFGKSLRLRRKFNASLMSTSEAVVKLNSSRNKSSELMSAASVSTSVSDLVSVMSISEEKGTSDEQKDIVVDNIGKSEVERDDFLPKLINSLWSFIPGFGKNSSENYNSVSARDLDCKTVCDLSRPKTVNVSCSNTHLLLPGSLVSVSSMSPTLGTASAPTLIIAALATDA